MAQGSKKPGEAKGSVRATADTRDDGAVRASTLVRALTDPHGGNDAGIDTARLAETLQRERTQRVETSAAARETSEEGQ